MVPCQKSIDVHSRSEKSSASSLVPKASLAAFLFCALSQGMPLSLLAQQQEYALNPKELSKSITAEALSQSNGQPVTGAPGYLAGMIASTAGSMNPGATNGDPNAQTRSERAPNIAGLLPSVPFALADGTVTGNLSPERASM